MVKTPDKTPASPPDDVTNAEIQNDQLMDDLDRLKADNDALKAELAQKDAIIKDLMAQQASVPRVKVDGYLLAPGDPYAAGTMRAYRAINPDSKQPPYLPFVLPYAERDGLRAMLKYLVRAAAAGDTDRVRAVKRVIGNFKQPLDADEAKQLKSLLAG